MECYFERFKAVVVILLLPLIFGLYSCDIEVEQTTKLANNNSDKEDSTKIVNSFNLAIQQRDVEDSLISIAQKLGRKNDFLQTIYQINLSKHLILSGQLDSAKQQIQLSMQEFAADTLNYHLARLHNLMAAVHGYLRNQERSVYHFKQAIKVYEHHNDERHAAVVRFNLANIFFGRQDYNSAYKYSLEAYKKLKEEGDTSMQTLCLAVLSIAENNLGMLDDAIQHAEMAEELSKVKPSLQATIFANYAMGEASLAQNQVDESIAYFLKSIEVGEEHKMLQWLIPVRATLMKAYLEKGENEKVISLGKLLLEQAKSFGNEDIQYSVNNNIATAYASLGESDSAFVYLKKASDLYKEDITKTNERAIQEMIAKYETEPKNNIIRNQENQLIRQRAWLVGSIVLIVLFALGLILLLKYTKQKSKLLIQEKENAIIKALQKGEEKERLRLSNELHDGVASNLVAIKMQIEGEAENQNRSLLNLVAKTHKEVRKVAHNLSPINFEKSNLIEAIENFVNDFENSSLKMFFHSGVNGKIKDLSNETALLLYRAVQELIQNSVKHAQATEIHFQLTKIKEGSYRISIEDNGKGFDLNSLNPQSSLIKLESRLKTAHIEMSLDSTENKGTSVFINFETKKVKK